MQYAELQSRLKSSKSILINKPDCRQASVALLVSDISGRIELFFIERARNENDPWSGQIAFPGGNFEQEDKILLSTAIRETREEVGITLAPENVLGRLDDQQGRSNYRELPLVISCFVFDLYTEQKIQNNLEVEDSFWIPLDHLLNPQNQFEYYTSYAPDPYPAVRLDRDRVLWGLTYRFVQMFLKTIE